MIYVKQFTVNHFEVNCFVLWDDSTKQCAIVDPAAEANYEEAQIVQYIADNGLVPSMVLLTHAHVDHIAGLRQVCERYRLPVTLHEDGVKLLRQDFTFCNCILDTIRTSAARSVFVVIRLLFLA